MARKRLQVLISARLDLRLRKAAERAQVSRGAWVRQAIEERLAHASPELPEIFDVTLAASDVVLP